jgi:hypothetical protein
MDAATTAVNAMVIAAVGALLAWFSRAGSTRSTSGSTSSLTGSTVWRSNWTAAI